MTLPMLARFQGEGGRACLIAALRLQQIVGDEEHIAAELAEVAQLVVSGATAADNVLIHQGACPSSGYQGDVRRSDAAAPSLARGITSAYYRNRKKDFRNLASLFCSRSALQASVLALAQKKFPNIDWRNRSTGS